MGVYHTIMYSKIYVKVLVFVVSVLCFHWSEIKKKIAAHYKISQEHLNLIPCTFYLNKGNIVALIIVQYNVYFL